MIISRCCFAEYDTEMYHLEVRAFRAARVLSHVQPITFLFSGVCVVAAAVI